VTTEWAFVDGEQVAHLFERMSEQMGQFWQAGSIGPFGFGLFSMITKMESIVILC
jgi:hypothetical protein